jgi:hypothetical protein
MEWVMYRIGEKASGATAGEQQAILEVHLKE